MTTILEPRIRHPEPAAPDDAPPPPGPSVVEGQPHGAGPSLACRAWVGAVTFGHRHAASIAVLGGLLLVTGLVHGIGMYTSPGPFDDEGTYMAQAWAVEERGTLAHYTYWYDHPPLGWLTLAAWNVLSAPFTSGDPAITAGRQAMLVVHLLSVALVYVIARRLGIRRAVAAVAVALFSLSPLAIAYQRMIFLDNIAVLWVLVAFALALSPQRRLWSAAAAGAAMAAAVLTKETALVLVPAVAWQLWIAFDRRTRAFALALAASLFGLVAAVYPLYALLKAELLPGDDHVSLIEGVVFQLTGRVASGSIFDGGSIAFRVVGDWLRLDAWTLGLGVIVLPVALATRRLRAVGVALALQLVLLLRTGYLPIPFVIALLPFAALVAAGTLDQLAGAVAGRAGRLRSRHPALPAAVGGLAMAGLVASVALSAVPSWAAGAGRLMADAPAPMDEARTWISAELPRDRRLLVDNTMWVDLVEAGFDDDLQVVWFYKLDFTNNLDPSVASRLPGGWREFDYVVSTSSMRDSVRDSPGGLEEVRLALDRSEPVKVFGAGADRVEVRRIDRSVPDDRGTSR